MNIEQFKTMKTIYNIYKAILLYSTTILCVLTMCILESVIEQHNWEALAALLLLCAGGVFACCNILTYKELYKLSGTYYFERFLK